MRTSPQLQRERRIVGFTVLQQIDVYCELSASKPLVIEVDPGWVSFGFEIDAVVPGDSSRARRSTGRTE
jgi:hypothetical protein